jgi:hypothetical protein
VTLCVAALAIGLVTTAVLGWGPFATSAGEQVGGEVRLPATAPLLVPDTLASGRLPTATPDRATTDRAGSGRPGSGRPGSGRSGTTGGAAAPAGGPSVIVDGDGIIVGDVEVVPGNRAPRPGTVPSPTTEATEEATGIAPAGASDESAPDQRASAGATVPPVASAARRRLALRVNRLNPNYRVDPDRPRMQLVMDIANPDSGSQRQISLVLTPDLAAMAASAAARANTSLAAGTTPSMRARIDVVDTTASIDQLQMRLRMDVVADTASKPVAVDAGQGDGASNVIELTVPLAPPGQTPVNPAPPTDPDTAGDPDDGTPADPSEPATPDEPQTPAESADPSTPAHPATPADPDKPAEPSTPTEPAGPSTPAEPAGPSTPAEPADPRTPDKPSEPTEPTAPADPETPPAESEPETPAEADPGTSAEPSEPGTPAQPSEPGTAAEPTEPAEPETPAGPSEPETPAEPDDPQTPDDPETPDTPEAPSGTGAAPVAEVLLPLVDPDAEVPVDPDTAKSSVTVAAPPTPTTGDTAAVPVAIALHTAPAQPSRPRRRRRAGPGRGSGAGPGRLRVRRRDARRLSAAQQRPLPQAAQPRRMPSNEPRTAVPPALRRSVTVRGQCFSSRVSVAGAPPMRTSIVSPGPMTEASRSWYAARPTLSS